jgi:hypothetical protein
MTAWTDEQWAVFCACIAEWWPGEFTDGARSAWRIALDAVDPATAMLTAKQLLHSGEKFRPSCSSFLFAVRRDPSRPTFDEALLLIRRALMATYTDGEAIERLSPQPLVAAFASRQGVARLRTLPIDDPDWGEKTRRELREAWDRHVDAFDGREIAAIASGSSDLRQLDPLASLQLGSGAGDGGE